ncbi:unnamed protein product [Rodentolepis nana]|uniref:Serine/threonine-protein kinase TOR n=1 Tax=Rodentolepis nana TaxID=102285 RepID=A0A0R3T718_RODNA|nr:unnamed protein product [Rodentolepis nana]
MFIGNHPKLEFLGLALWPLAAGYVSITQLSQEYPNIEMIGGLSEQHLIRTISRYPDRTAYYHSATYILFQRVQGSHVFSPNLFECLLNYLEDKYKRRRLVGRAIFAIDWLTNPERYNNTPMHLLERARDIILTIMDDGTVGSNISSYGCNVLTNLLKIEGVEINYRKCCKILFKFLPGESSTVVRERALGAIRELLGRMPDADFVDARRCKRYIECLMRCLLEYHVPKGVFQQWALFTNHRGVRYLKEFHNFVPSDRGIDCAQILSQFIGNSYEACLRFVFVGGFPLLRLVIRYSSSELQLLDNYSQLQGGHLLSPYV